MKNIFAFILTVMMLCSLWGCKQTSTEAESTPVAGATQIETEKATLQETTSKPVEVTPENWGVREWWSAQTADTSHVYSINFPNYSGYTEGSGMIAEQLDGTIALISGQNALLPGPEISDASEMFPAYFYQLQGCLEAFYGLLAKNFEFSVTDDEAVEVNGLEMHSFKGKMQFDDDDEHKEFQFVIYATQLKTNGAYAYWVVYDVSEDQSKGDLITEHALNMAKTFREAE